MGSQTNRIFRLKCHSSRSQGRSGVLSPLLKRWDSKKLQLFQRCSTNPISKVSQTSMLHVPRLYGSNISTRWQAQVFNWEDLPSPMDLAYDPGLQIFCLLVLVAKSTLFHFTGRFFSLKHHFFLVNSSRLLGTGLVFRIFTTISGECTTNFPRGRCG